MKRSINLTEGNIWKVLVVFALPIFVGQIFQNLYSSVDSVVVGRFVSSDALGAVNASASISGMLVGFFTGLSAGVGVVFASSFGAKNYHKLHDAIHTAMTFSLVVGGSIGIIGVFISPWMLHLVNCDPEIMLEANNYLRIYMIGVTFTAIYNVGAGVLRSIGDSQSPFYFLVISSITNMILDLVFVVCLNWGVSGVAVATVISQGISLALVIRKMMKLDERYALRIKDLKIDFSMLKEVLMLGLPAAIQSSITSISNLFVNRYINSFSKAATAGIGTAMKIDRFAGMACQSVGLAIPTFISQNCGAKNYERAKEGVKVAVLLCSMLIVVPAVIIYMFPEIFARVFTFDEAVIAVIVGMLRTIMPFYLFMGFHSVLGGVIRGFGKSTQSTICSVSGMVVVRQIWLAVTLGANYVIQNVYWCYPVGWISATIFSFIYYWFAIKRKIDRNEFVFVGGRGRR